MKQIVEAIASSIATEIPTIGKIQRHSPIWRDPGEGPMLYVYGTRRSVGSYRTTGYREDQYEIAVELMEQANQEDLKRDQTAELAFQDKADSLVAWADKHQQLAPAHRLDFASLSYQDDLRRELFVRYARVTLLAYMNAVYS